MLLGIEQVGHSGRWHKCVLQTKGSGVGVKCRRVEALSPAVLVLLQPGREKCLVSRCLREGRVRASCLHER